MTDEKKYNIYWTKKYDDGRVVEHKSFKSWPLDNNKRTPENPHGDTAISLAAAGEKLTGGKPHTIREVDDTVPFERVIDND